MLRVAPLVVLLAWALLAPSAHAQGGAGLYEPFPSGKSTRMAKRYVDQVLPPNAKELTSPDIRRGVFVARPRTTASGAASARAGRGDGGGGSLPTALSLGIVAVAAGGGFSLASRRR
jgi:hypothetical protein